MYCLIAFKYEIHLNKNTRTSSSMNSPMATLGFGDTSGVAMGLLIRGLKKYNFMFFQTFFQKFFFKKSSLFFGKYMGHKFYSIIKASF